MTQETDSTTGTEFTVERVLAEAAHILAEPAEDIDPAENLFDRGMDSVRMMSLMERWRAAGAEVEFADLAEEPTIQAWVTLLNR
ncbi:phosphopantetheine-binding protein [Nocardiopsis exhalans]|uniref:Phosphopantetheine-binding protein n=1 Tax=Nocardiopsis exhalans TaxID=163604 RepID=A0ABY5D283_9ACTN|nr:phosphopantetheine-binding protein [Nocardiopsis exhalans]USY17292.1 phosphopantetheine-binding protein [Nocardiopsis exhalans]